MPYVEGGAGARHASTLCGASFAGAHPRKHPLNGGIHLAGILEGKVAIITGAGSGIGRATPKIFAREGAKLVLAEVVEDGGNETLSQGWGRERDLRQLRRL